MIDISFELDAPEPPKFRFSKVLRNLILVLACMILISLGVQVLSLESERKGNDFRGLLGELQVSTSQLSGVSRGSLAGDVASFKGLSDLRSSIDELWILLKKNVPQKNSILSAAVLGSEVLGLEVTEIEEVWSRIRHNTLVITQNETDVLLTRDMAITLNETLPNLQAEHANLVEIYLDVGSSAEQVSLALRQSWFAERIGRNLDKILRGNEGTEAAADLFYSDAIRFGKVLESMNAGNRVMGIVKAKDPATIKSLKRSMQLFGVIQGSFKEVFDRAPAVARTSQASKAIVEGSPMLLTRLILLSEKYDDYVGQMNYLKIVVSTTLIGISFFLLLIILLMMKFEIRRFYNNRN